MIGRRPGLALVPALALVLAGGGKVGSSGGGKSGAGS